VSRGGIFINGDEHRPESDAEYLAHLHWWAALMKAGLNDGLIPASFQSVFEAWHDRNIRRFGEPKSSADDFLETTAEQLRHLTTAGLGSSDVVWNEKLWGVIRARRVVSG
jgi:hypothetical protein